MYIYIILLFLYLFIYMYIYIYIFIHFFRFSHFYDIAQKMQVSVLVGKYSGVFVFLSIPVSQFKNFANKKIVF